MRDHSNHIELSREDAVARMLEESGFCAPSRPVPAEPVELSRAFGRILAAECTSRADAPNMLTCCMDSVAVKWEAFEDLPSGQVPDTSNWVRGVDWQFANTGVAMPDGFDTAIAIENIEVAPDEQSIRILAAPSARLAGTRPVGGQLKIGEVLAHAGDVVTPDVAARIASGNHTVALCVRQPRVAFIPTGNELVPAGVVDRPDANGRFAAAGKNFETNSLLVHGKTEGWGGVYIPFDIVPDEPECIEAALRLACQSADIVVLNAGSSKGSDDWSCEVMERIGHMVFHQTTHGPGHHSSFAMVDGTPVVGISGPSGGASFTLDFYLRPLMRAFLGLDPIAPKVPAVLVDAFPAGGPGGPGSSRKAKEEAKAPAGEKRPFEKHTPDSPFYGVKPLFVQMDEDGRLMAHPIAGRPGSSQAAHANALYMLASGCDIEPPTKGDIIYVELLS